MSFAKRYLWLLIILSVALGFIWPAPGLFLKSYLEYLLMLMMFISCFSINFKDLKQIKTDWWRYLVLMGSIFIIPTIIIYLFKNILNEKIFIGLIIAAAVPSAVSVVFISDLLKGKPGKALVSTTSAHLISPLLTPFLVWLLARQIIQVEFTTILILIFKLVFIPLILAQIVKRLGWRDKWSEKISGINTWLLIILLWGIIAPIGNLAIKNWHQVLLSMGIVIVVLAAQMSTGYWLGVDKQEKATWMISGSLKNFALASVIASSLFGPAVVVGAVAYGIINNLMIAPLQWWSKRIKN